MLTRAPRRQLKTIAAVRPNAGLEVAYQRKLESLIDDLHASILYWLTAAYRANEPEMAMDASPAATLSGVMNRLARRWQRNFDRGAPLLARWFAESAASRSDKALQAILRDAGFSVGFKLTAPMNDVIQATIAENVGLIRSIASQHLSDVQGMIMRSVSAGRDLGTLTKELEARYGLTRRRAALISLDQNNKMTANITRVRQRGLGIQTAIWQHSGGGKEPRPSHVAFSGKRYDIEDGALIDGKRIWPGTEINCRCVARSVLAGFED